tara:strand:- start:302 stop:664 length:363 start_codon:yes stop_codon:yes gene_type:complete
MSWEDIVKRKVSRMRNPMNPFPTALFESYNEYDDDELFEIMLLLLEKIHGLRVIDELKNDAMVSLAEVKQDESEDRYLKGMDEKEYLLRHILGGLRKQGKKEATLAQVFNAIFGKKDIDG